MTADESQVAGWYKSQMTFVPEPKPICTGSTLHTLCVTHGPLSTYKLFARVYGVDIDDDLNSTHASTSNLMALVNLYNLILEQFKGKDRCVIMNIPIPLHQKDNSIMFNRIDKGMASKKSMIWIELN